MTEIPPGLEIYLNCDEPDCPAEERVFDDDLPEGWMRREGEPAQTFCPAHHPTPKLREVPHIGPEQITDIVLGLTQDKIFCASMIPPNERIEMVFMPLALGGLGDYDPLSIGNVIEWMNKAGERSCNGLPMFMSCQLIHRDDWAVIVERATKAREAMEKAIRGD